LILFSIVFGVLTIGIGIIMGIMMYFNGDLETMIEAQKAAKGL
jgi:hypothetical protein